MAGGFELELSNIAAMQSANALIERIETIGGALGRVSTGSHQAMAKIATDLATIEAVSKRAAANLDAVAAAVGKINAAALGEQERAQRRAAQAARAAEKARLEEIKQNGDRQLAIIRANEKAALEQARGDAARTLQIIRESEARKVQTIRETQSAITSAISREETRRIAQIRANTTTELAEMRAKNRILVAENAKRIADEQAQLNRLKLSPADKQYGAAIKSNMDQVAAQFRASMQAQAQAQAAYNRAIESNMASLARSFRESERQKTEALKQGERARSVERKREESEMREHSRRMRQIQEQGAAGLRAAMAATGTSFGIFTGRTILVAAAIYGVVSAFKAVITEGAAFEDTMTRVNAVLEADAVTAQRVTDSVRRLAEETRFTATETAEAMLALSMAGLTADEALLALGPTLNMATIGMMDMASSAEMMTAVMHEFGLEAADLEHVADILSRASVDSTIAIRELGVSLSYVGPIAAISNNSLLDTVAVLQVLADNGIKGSRAGTSVRRAIDDLIQPSDDAAATMSRLGVSTHDAAGEMYTLVEFMRQLAIAGANNEDMASMFDLTTRSAMIALLEDIRQEFDEQGVAIDGVNSKMELYQQRNREAASSAEALRKAFDDTLTGDIALLRSAASEKALAIFEQLGPQVRQVVQDMTGFIKSLDADRISDAVMGFSDLVREISKLVMALGEAKPLLEWVISQGSNPAPKGEIFTMVTPWGSVDSGVRRSQAIDGAAGVTNALAAALTGAAKAAYGLATGEQEVLLVGQRLIAVEREATDYAKLKNEEYQKLLATTRELANISPPSAGSAASAPADASNTDALFENSKARIDYRQAELEHMAAMDEQYLSGYLASYKSAEQDVLRMRKERLGAQEAALNDSINTELLVMEAQRTALEKQAYEAKFNSGMDGRGGDVPEVVTTALADVNKRISELLNQREEIRRKHSQQIAALNNQEAAAERARYESLNQMADQLSPIHAAQTAYLQGTQALIQVQEAGKLSADELAAAWERLNQAYFEATQPAAYMIQQLEERLELTRAQAEAERTLNFIEVARLTYKQQDVAATEEQIQAMAALLRQEELQQREIQAMNDQAEQFERAWTRALDRVDTAFEDLWKSVFNGFENFRDTLKDAFMQLMAFLAHQAVTKPILMNLGLTSTAFAGAASGASGGGVGSLTSLLPAVAGNALGGLGAAGMGLLNKMGVVTANQAAAMNLPANAAGVIPSGMNLVKSGLYGAAGGWAGTQLGESLFNKQAESSWGSSVLGVVGTIMGGPVGAAIGAAIGGAIDAFTGGDGKKRFSAGFSVGAPAVKSQYEFGTTQFDSGLTVTNIARRVEESAATSVIDYFKALDAAFSSTTRGAGINLDLSGTTTIRGSTADAGVGGAGSFFGLKDFNGLGSRDALEAQGVTFVRELIAQVSGGFSDEMKAVIDSATGSAEDILKRYEDVLALDGVFSSGNRIFTDIDNFTETLHLLEDQFRINSESLTDTAARVMAANDALSAIGLGNGSSSSAAFAMELADAAGGVDNFTALVGEFTTVMGESEAYMEVVAERMRSAVTQQFADLGLTLDSFDIESFASYFDQVKDSMNAVDLIKLMRAGASLNMLIEQEEQLAEIRSEAAEAQLKQVEEIIDANDRFVTSIASLRENVADALRDMQDTSPSLLPVTGTIEEQIAAAERNYDIIMDQYEEALAAERELHQERLKHYEDLVKAGKSIKDTLRDLSLSEVSPLTSKQRRDQLLAEFNTLFTKAQGGDAEAAGKIGQVATDFLKVERERETINDTFLSSYDDITSRLAQLGTSLENTPYPGEEPESSAATVAAIAKLQQLQNQLIDLQSAIGYGTLDKLGALELALKNLPAELAAKLREQMGPELLQLLQLGTNFSILSDNIAVVAAALGLLPQKPDLSSDGIAGQIEQLTRLSQFPELLGQSFSDTVGTVLVAMAQQGANVQQLASMVSSIPSLVEAWNKFASQNGFKDVNHYVNNGGSSGGSSSGGIKQAIVNMTGGTGSLSTNAVEREKQVKDIYAAAIASGKSAADIASDLGNGKTAADINAIAKQYGLPAFGDGGRVDKPTFAAIAERGVPEYVAPVDKYAVVERKAIVSDLTASQQASNAAVVDAINRQTEAMERGGNGGDTIVIKVVTSDGRQTAEYVIKDLHKRSKNGEIVINAKGIEQ